jgi:hypothetical protein
MEKDAEQVRRDAEAGQTGGKVAASDPAVAPPAPAATPAVSANGQAPAKAETKPQAPSAAKPQAKATPSKEHVLNMSSRERAGQGGPVEVAAVLVLCVVGIIGVLVILFGGG